MLLLKHLPNTLTACNVLAGCVGLSFLLKGELSLAAYSIWVGMLFDFSDGLVARLLNAPSEIGKQLDSLADMLTFGALPSLLVYTFLAQKTTFAYPFVAFSLAIFSALRLAKFNIDSRQADSFIGLPTPANALFWSALAFAPVGVSSGIWLYVITGLIPLMSYLLVAELPLFALKFKTYNLKTNAIKYVFLFISLILLFVWQFLALPLIIALYIVFSIILNLSKK